MIQWRRKNFLAMAAMLFLCTMQLFSQTNPTPHSLTTSDYSLTQWANTNAAGTYPASMIFHQYAAIDPVLATEPNNNYTDSYSKTSGARIVGLGANGFSFVNTGTATNTGGFVGNAVLALNTQGRQNIQVTWTGGTVATGGREYRIRLQYRVGTAAAWTDVLSGGNPVEYVMNVTNGHSQVLGPVALPSDASNQPVVQLRWKYIYITGSGTRPELRVDDITVTSQAAAIVPTKLVVTQITPANPSTSTPFSITVQSQDNTNTPGNVTTATNFSLSLAAGTGTLSGTISGTIPAGSSTTTVSGINYSKAENGVQIQVTRTSGDALSSGVSAAFNVSQGATQLAFVNAPTLTTTNNPVSTFTVEARRPDNTVDATASGSVTLTKISGPGNIAGTVTRTPSNGIASFSDISFTQAGTYTVQASSGSLTPATFTIVVNQAPIMTELLIPQFIKSTVGSGQSTRVPSFALIRLDSLQPNMAYRFVTGNDTVLNSTSVGAGNNLHYNPTTGTYTYSTSKYFGSGPANNTNSSGFTTGANQRSITIWINNTASTNAIFTTGNNLRWVLTLADTNGNRITRLVSSGTSRTIDFGTTATTATGIANRRSYYAPKNYVALFDNVTGSGSPVSTAIVQEDEAIIAAGAPFYTELDDDSTAWATMIPNNLPNGIRRIEQRSPSGQLISAMTDNDGTWNISNTINPSTGINAVYLGEIALAYPTGGETLCRANTHTVTWTSYGVDTLAVELSTNSGATFTQLATVPASAMQYLWNIPATLPAANTYMLRLSSIKTPFVSATSTPFSIAIAPNITTQPQSVVRCAGDSVVLSVGADGTGLTYQWQRDGRNIPGANQPTFVISGGTPSVSGEYRVIITGQGTCAGATSQSAVVFINQPTRITQQPENRTAVAGGAARFRVEAEVVEPATYQWYRGNQLLTDNGRITGARSSVLTIQNVGQSDVDSTYRVVVTARCGIVTSNSARLQISSLAVSNFTQTENPCLGGTTNLSATVERNPLNLDVEYLWTFNGSRLSNTGRITGTDTPNLNISNYSATDTGTYVLTAIARSTGATATQTFRLTALGTAPTITQNPQSQAVCPGTQLALSGAATGTGAISYQWYRNGQPIEGATTVGYTTNFADSLAGQYTLIAITACGMDTSSAATITARQSTIITQNLATGTEIMENTELRLTVGATGEGNLTYQWYKNGQLISNATNPTYLVTRAAASDAGTYYVVVKGECDSANSVTTTVVVGPNSVHEIVESDGIILDQNTPNPAMNYTSVSFHIPAAMPVSIIVTDVLGRKVEEITLGMMNEGRHFATIRSENLPTGMYYYTLSTPQTKLTRTLTIVK